MHSYVTFYDFRDRFMQSDTYKGNFTTEGLWALFQYLEEYEDSTGENIEFDMIALCCGYSEYESPEEALEAYAPGFLPDMGGNENPDLVELSEASRTQSIAELEQRTTVIHVEGGGVIIQNF